jgi:hypothetical protein
MRIILEYQRWRKGAQHVFGNNASNLSGAQFMQATLASTDRINFRVRYQLINGLVFQLSADYIEGNSNGVYQFQAMEKLGRTSDVWFGLGIQVGL